MSVLPSKSLRNQKGLTLIDAMLCTAVLAISISAVASIQSYYTHRQATYLKRMIAQNIMSGFVANLQVQARNFPAVQGGNSRPGVYVFCFGKEGMPVANFRGDQGAWTDPAISDFTKASRSCGVTAETKANGTAPNSGYEMHFVRDLNDPSVGELYLVGLRNEGANSPDEQLHYYMKLYIPPTN